MILYNTTSIYNVGINNECYVDNTKPIFQWLNNTEHFVHVYDHEKLNHWPKFDKCLDGVEKLWSGDTEGFLLTSLMHGNLYVKRLKIKRSEISDNAALVISNFLKTNKKIFETFELSQNTISSEGIKMIMKAIQTNTTLKIIDI